jgi:hypothetical protein
LALLTYPAEPRIGTMDAWALRRELVLMTEHDGVSVFHIIWVRRS